ncbi:MAG: hypothetical protein GX075_10550 [Firmicutes bacterium]|nr:hypothetical protein [Bacillota bacterium]
MSHRHSENSKPEAQPVAVANGEAHPFLTKNDLTLLTMVTPFLSANGQKLLSFFINFNNRAPAQAPDLSGIFNLSAGSGGNRLLQELLPALLALAGKTTEQGGFDPGLLTALMGIINNNTGNAAPETPSS